MSFLYRVTVNKLTTRALIARRQLEALAPPGTVHKESPPESVQSLQGMANLRDSVVLHVLLEAPSLPEIEKAVESDLGDLDSIEALIAETALLGDCIKWPSPPPPPAPKAE
jgi:hypothetical protein